VAAIYSNLVQLINTQPFNLAQLEHGLLAARDLNSQTTDIVRLYFRLWPLPKLWSHQIFQIAQQFQVGRCLEVLQAISSLVAKYSADLPLVLTNLSQLVLHQSQSALPVVDFIFNTLSTYKDNVWWLIVAVLQHLLPTLPVALQALFANLISTCLLQCDEQTILDIIRYTVVGSDGTRP